MLASSSLSVKINPFGTSPLRAGPTDRPSERGYSYLGTCSPLRSTCAKGGLDPGCPTGKCIVASNGLRSCSECPEPEKMYPSTSPSSPFRRAILRGQMGNAIATLVIPAWPVSAAPNPLLVQLLVQIQAA